MEKFSFKIIAPFVFIIFINCLKTNFYQKADLGSLNQRLLLKDEVNLITPGGTEYLLQISYFDSTSIQGKGLRKSTSEEYWQPFQGSLSLDSIKLIKIRKGDFGKSVSLYFGGSALLILSQMAQEGPENPELHIYYPGGTSCPFIYSWNGSSYQLEAEAFGRALGKALEIETANVLSSIKEDKGLLNIRITNERPETHYINRVSLSAVMVPDKVQVVLDSENQPWAIQRTVSPVSAFDISGDSVLPLVAYCDESYWESDLDRVSSETYYKEQINLTFIKTYFTGKASLLLRAINTQLTSAAFDGAFQFLGNRSLEFYRALENDPEWINIGRQWIENCAMKAFLWQGGSWHPIGRILPEANVTPFTRLLHFDLPNLPDDTIRIRLEMLADMWKIDAIQMAFSETEPLVEQAVALLSAQGPGIKEASSFLSQADEQYIILLPPQKLDLSYIALTPSSAGTKMVYIIHVQGYLHEWYQENNRPNLLADFVGITEHQKLNFLKIVLQNPPLFLPRLYDMWRADKKSYQERKN